MQVKVLTLRYSEWTRSIETKSLREATHGRDVIGVKHEFFFHGGVPHLTLILELADAAPPQAAQLAAGGAAPTAAGPTSAPVYSVDPERYMDDEQRRFYAKVREWRNQTCRALHWNAYELGRNVDIATLVFKAPKTMDELVALKPFKPDLINRFGLAVLKELEGLQPREPKDRLAAGGTPS